MGSAEYLINIAVMIGIYLILAQGFNLTFGLGQLFNLAHVASYSIGAYATALLSTESGAGFFTCITASILLSMLFALLIGAISLRLTSDYFAIGSLAFASVVSALIINCKSVTHGVLGIPGIPRPAIGGIDFENNLNFLILLYAFVAASLILLYLIFKSSYARALRAQAEYEPAALSIGKNASLQRNISFVIASGFAGLAGAFYAYYINYVDPTSFSFTEMVFVLTIAVVGGPGSFIGTIFATVFLVVLPEALRFTDLPSSILGPMRQMLQALVLFGVVWVYRARLFPVRREI